MRTNESRRRHLPSKQAGVEISDHVQGAAFARNKNSLEPQQWEATFTHTYHQKAVQAKEKRPILDLPAFQYR